MTMPADERKSSVILRSILRTTQAAGACVVPDARLQLKSDLGELSGRTAILGLAVADRATGRELVRSGLFRCLLNDVTEGIEVFNDRGRARLATIPRASLSDSSSPIVLWQPDCAGLRGGLAPDGWRAVGYGDDPKDIEITLWSVENAWSRS